MDSWISQVTALVLLIGSATPSLADEPELQSTFNAVEKALRSDLTPPPAASCQENPADTPRLDACVSSLGTYSPRHWDRVKSSIRKEIRENRIQLPSELSVEEMMALRLYTSAAGFAKLNQLLRKGPPDSLAVESCRQLINSALQSLPAHADQFVLRGIYLPSQEIEKLKPGSLHQFNAFTSTSISRPFTKGTQFLIHSRSGRNISAFSTMPIEEEVLFGSPTCFKVAQHFKSRDFSQQTREKPWDQVDLKTMYQYRPDFEDLILLEEVPCAQQPPSS